MQTRHCTIPARTKLGVRITPVQRASSSLCRAAPRPVKHPDPAIELQNGKPTSGPDLSVNVNGLHMPNPFVIGSGVYLLLPAV